MSKVVSIESDPRSWDFSEGANKEIVQPKQVVVLPISKELFKKDATTFLDFDLSNPFAVRYVTLFQALLYATIKMEECAKEMESSYYRNPSVDQFAQLRLETVYSNDVENPKVLQYRLWIFVTNSVVNIGHGLEALLKENRIIREKHTTRKRKAIDWASNLLPHEQYRMIPDKATWSKQLCDLYVGPTRTSYQMDKVESRNHPLWDSTNPANPANVFNVPDAILLHTRANAHPEQRKIESYRIHDSFNGVVNYKFPRFDHLPHHILRIPFDKCAPSNLLQMVS